MQKLSEGLLGRGRGSHWSAKQSSRCPRAVMGMPPAPDMLPLRCLSPTQEVDAELEALEDSTHIDMSLITDAPAAASRAPSRRSPSLSNLSSRISQTLSSRSSIASDGADD